MNFFTTRSKLPSYFCLIAHQQNSLHRHPSHFYIIRNVCFRKFSSSLGDQWRQHYNRSNVPIIHQNAPDLSQGIPFEYWKDYAEEQINGELQQGNFANACDYWKKFLDNTQSVDGIFQLIDYALINYKEDEVKLAASIKILWQQSRKIMHTSDFLSYLVIAMAKNGHRNEAEFFAKKFTIYGTSFIRPLKIVAEKSEPDFFETFAQILERVYLKVPKRTKTWKRKKPVPVEMVETTTMIELPIEAEDGSSRNTNDQKKEIIAKVNCDKMIAHQETETQKQSLKIEKFKSLLWIWDPPNFKDPNKQRKMQKQQLHKIDEVKLEKLIGIFLLLWIKRIREIGDLNHWEYFNAFLERNRLTVPNSVMEKTESDEEKSWQKGFC